jgi:beta-glucosidase
VVQLYSADLIASLIPDVKRLRRFEKIALKSGETKNVTFKLTQNDLSFINLQNQRVVEPGDFEFQIGNSSANIQSTLKCSIVNAIGKCN